MTTTWAHLPNAALIDAVLADVKARPEAWVAAEDAAADAAWDDTWDAARDAARVAAWSDAKAATRRTAWVAARAEAEDAGWDAIYALIAWDDCAHLLDLPSDTLRTMADLCDAPACHQAVLLLPYALVREAA